MSQRLTKVVLVSQAFPTALDSALEGLNMAAKKRTTVYKDADLYRALQLRAGASNRTISEVVGGAVRIALAEDAMDLAAFDQRASEPNIAWTVVVNDLRQDYKL
ncbi:MAG: CopG family transcriptional regulator [Dehalococcoidia bacterium]|nr:CopG family transcriptional regulator [Dehalococcoidia bacterium]